MKTIFRIIKTAREYNRAIDNILAVHDVGKESTVYWAYVPKLYCDYISPSYAKDCIEEWKADGESYKDIVSDYCYFIQQELDEIIDGLRTAHELTDFKHMQANLIGLQAAYEYLEIIDRYWKDLLD